MNTVRQIARGILAGLMATSILSLLMLMKKSIPQLDTVMLLDKIAHRLAMNAGLPTPFAGWLWHFIIGSLLWGWMYAVMEPIIPSTRPWLKGLYFGLWLKGLYLGLMVTLLVWFAVLPIAGAGALGTPLSLIQISVSLIQHLVYGVVLAFSYHWLSTVNK